MKLFYEIETKLVFVAESKEQLLGWMKSGECFLTCVSPDEVIELNIIAEPKYDIEQKTR